MPTKLRAAVDAVNRGDISTEAIDRVCGGCLEAADELERLQSKWQPIETAPRDGTRILLFQRNWNKVHFGFRGSDGWLFYDECIWSEALQEDICRFNIWLDDKHGPTHWMPLPEPPTQAE